MLRTPSSESMGVFPPMSPAPGILPWGASRTISPWPGNLWDNTSVSSVGRVVVAVGSESLFIADALKDPSEEDKSMRALDGLHGHICHDKKQ